MTWTLGPSLAGATRPRQQLLCHVHAGVSPHLKEPG